MPPVRDFVANLAHMAISANQVQDLVGQSFGKGSMSRSQINQILKAAKEGKNMEDHHRYNAKKTARTAANIEAVDATLSDNRRSNLIELKLETGLSDAIISGILNEDLGLVKKSACWVPHLLSKDQKKERVNISGNLFGTSARRLTPFGVL